MVSDGFLFRERREVPPPSRTQPRVRSSGLDRSISLREKESPKIDREKDSADENRGSRSARLQKRVIHRRRSNSIGSGGSGEYGRVKEKFQKREENRSPRRNAKWDWDEKIKQQPENLVSFIIINQLKLISLAFCSS